MKKQAEIDAFIKSRCVATTPVVDGEGGDPLLTRDDALFLLTSIVQDGGPMMSYLDIYSLGIDGELKFINDLTMSDDHFDQNMSETKWCLNLMKHLEAIHSDALVSFKGFHFNYSLVLLHKIDARHAKSFPWDDDEDQS